MNFKSNTENIIYKPQAFYFDSCSGKYHMTLPTHSITGCILSFITSSYERLGQYIYDGNQWRPIV